MGSAASGVYIGSCVPPCSDAETFFNTFFALLPFLLCFLLLWKSQIHAIYKRNNLALRHKLLKLFKCHLFPLALISLAMS